MSNEIGSIIRQMEFCLWPKIKDYPQVS